MLSAVLRRRRGLGGGPGSRAGAARPGRHARPGGPAPARTPAPPRPPPRSAGCPSPTQTATPAPAAAPPPPPPPPPPPQTPQDLRQRLAADRRHGQLVRPHPGPVLQKVGQGRPILPHRRIQRGHRLGGALEPDHLVGRQPQLGGQLLIGRLPTQHLDQPAGGPPQPPHLLIDMDREADGPGPPVGHPPSDRLADPPGGIGGELAPLAPVELLHRPQQAQVALLDQIPQGQPGGREPAGDRHHQPQIRLDHPAPGPLPPGGHGLQVGSGRIIRAGVSQPGPGVQTGLIGLGQLDLILSGQQPMPPNLIQIQPEQVGGLGLQRPHGKRIGPWRAAVVRTSTRLPSRPPAILRYRPAGIGGAAVTGPGARTA
jgi:hypothetical protein